VTPVRGKRGSLVHAVTTGMRRDLAPEDVPILLCGRRLRGPIVVDEEIDCPACLDIIERAN
jgi:hypothetical protein